MADTAGRIMNNREKLITQIANEIDLMNGENTIALDITKQSNWTDYFIISTVTSETHLKGLYSKIYDILDSMKIVPLSRHRKSDSNNWVLIDCGFFVIHLMDRETRDYYDLEKLWFESQKVFQSSKSS